MRHTTQSRLAAAGACSEALEWIGQRSLARAWRECRRVDWMIWLLERMGKPLWTDQERRLFACDCAEHVLPIWEARYPDDARPRRAIEVARAYARGKATAAELVAARAAVRDAVWDAEDATEDSAGDAAWAAARAAAGDAAGDVWDAVGAYGAAWVAAEVVEDVAGDVAAAAERAWQSERLRHYIPDLPHGLRLRGE